MPATIQEQLHIPGLNPAPPEPRTYTYLSDPGHGWLIVPLADVRAAGFRPSEFSFYQGSLAYLEEDADMPAFLALMPNPPTITDQSIDRDAPCRNFRRFTPPGR